MKSFLVSLFLHAAIFTIIFFWAHNQISRQSDIRTKIEVDIREHDEKIKTQQQHLNHTSGARIEPHAGSPAALEIGPKPDESEIFTGASAAEVSRRMGLQTSIE